MWYITYNINTREVERMDDTQIVIQESDLNTIKLEDDKIPEDIFNRMYIYRITDDGEFYIDEDAVTEFNKDRLREKREPLLKAFDIYKSNLIVGAISLPDEEKQEVITWYNLILDLDEKAINNPPKVIAKYIQVNEGGL